MKILQVNSSTQTEMINITSSLRSYLESINAENGILTVFIPHTTAAVTINENADPDVQRDILYEINKIVPFNDNYRHFEGNSAAHLKASLFGSSESIIVENGQMQLGTWQGIYFCEFDGPRNRKIILAFNNSGK